MDGEAGTAGVAGVAGLAGVAGPPAAGVAGVARVAGTAAVAGVTGRLSSPTASPRKRVALCAGAPCAASHTGTIKGAATNTNVRSMPYLDPKWVLRLHDGVKMHRKGAK